MPHPSRSLNGLSVRAFLRPYDPVHDRYSAYYREGLRRHVARVGGHYEEVAMTAHPHLLKAMRRVRDMYHLRPLFSRARWVQPALDRLGSALEGAVHAPAGAFAEEASHYLITPPGGREARVCIAAGDDGSLVDARLLEWCDIYFKTNFWPAWRYDPKVRPLVNADPLVVPQLAAFRAYRSCPKERDLCMVVRVWGGKDEVEGVEHNLRLIEAVARARCAKHLYAYLVAGDIEAAARRLSRQGIPCGTAPLPPRKLWRLSAASRLNVIRLGMHDCVPWRVCGALAIGSAIVLDRAPHTRWPQPLVEGEHYLSLGTDTPPGQPVASDAQYAAIPERIEAWLADGELARRIGRANGDYYDRFVDPERVGEHVASAAQRHALAAGPHGSNG